MAQFSLEDAVNVDFHLYGTYMAARAAGFDKEDSHLIAQHAQLTDEAYREGVQLGAGLTSGGALSPVRNQWVKKREGSQKWKPEYITSGHLFRTGHFTLSGGLMSDLIPTNPSRDPEFAITWIAFHFLPGLEDGLYDFDLEGKLQVLKETAKAHKKGIFHSITPAKLGSTLVSEKKLGARAQKLDRSLHEIEMTKSGKPKPTKWSLKQQLICAPNSVCAQLMVQDIKQLADLKSKSHPLSFLEQLQLHAEHAIASPADFFKATEKTLEILQKEGFSTTFSFRRFMLALIGVRMHVLADTFAHQGFAGLRSAAINDVTDFKIEGKKAPQAFEKIAKSTGNLLALTFFGHGRAIHFPDYPGAIYSYTRPRDKKEITRDNSASFAIAYRTLVNALQSFGMLMGRARDDWQQGAFSPDRIDESWFRATGKVGGVEDTKSRDYFSAVVKAADDSVLLDWSAFGGGTKLHPDHAIATTLWKSSPIDLGYFSLAAWYHEQWVRRVIERHYNALGVSGSYGDILNKILAPAGTVKLGAEEDVD